MRMRDWLLALAAAALVTGCTAGISPDAAAPTDAAAEAPTASAELSDVTPVPGSLNLLATVLADEELSVLGDALVAAGLAPELEGETAYTLLAPTNAAFEALPPGVLDSLLAEPGTLADVLRYHLIAGATAAAGLAPLGMALTLQGEEVAVALSQDATLIVNDANVIQPDILAANGVIHKIDAVLLPTTAQALLAPTPAAAAPVTGSLTGTVTGAVTATVTGTAAVTETVAVTAAGDATATAGVTDTTLLPTPTPAAATAVTGTTPATGTTAATGTTTLTPVTTLTSTAEAGQTIVDVLATRPELSTLATAVAAGGWAEALAEPGPFTFFASTNAAFERVDPAELESLLNDIPRLARTIQYHVVADFATAADLARLGSALSTLNQPIIITLDENGQIQANGAPVLESIQTANGIVHILDGILIPADE